MKARRRRSWFDLRTAIACSLLFHAALAVAFKSHEVPPPQIRFEQSRQSVEATFVPLQPSPPEPPPAKVEPAPPPPPEPTIIAAQEAEVEVAAPPEPEPEIVEEPPPEPAEPTVEAEPLPESPPEPAGPVTPTPPAPSAPPEPDAIASDVATEAVRGVQDVQDFPAARYCPPPRYPASARREGREGLVLLAIRVSREGRVQDVQLARSSGYDDLDARALSTVRRWRFEPLEGRTALTFEYPIQFTLQ